MDAMNDHEQDKQLRILQGPLVSKSALDNGDGHDHGDEEIVDDTLREHRLELSTVREKLSGKSGKQYWRTLEELSEDPHFEELLHREFPRHASEWDDAVDRRDFLKLMGASLALAGLAGCGRPDESRISKCKWGPVARPVMPTAPIRVPAARCWPGSTSMALKWQYMLIRPRP